MADLPPEDKPDEIWVGPVGPIPIIDEDDPRFEEERAAHSSATKRAQALHSAEELLKGVRDVDWRVRFESIPRLVARWENDPRTLEALVHLAKADERPEVRRIALSRLTRYEADDVEPTIEICLRDSDPEVRDEAQYVRWQLGLSDQPPTGWDSST